MPRKHDGKNRIAWKLGTCGGLLLVALLAMGGKPPPAPPPEGGVIYYTDAGGCWQMNTDGSGKTLVLTGPGADGFLEPSRDLHGGVRWFLTLSDVDMAGETYPDGLPRREVYALSTAGGRVQITEDPSVQAFNDQLSLIDTFLRWSSGDRRVSFIARRWGVDAGTGADVVVEQGIFAADLAADVAAGPATAAPHRLPLDLETRTDGSLAIEGIDWSPDGSQLAYCDCTDVFVVDPATGVKTKLPVSIPARCRAWLRWSPTGEKISVCDTPYLVRTFAPNGSGDTVILEWDSRKLTLPNFVIWSPSGANIVYREHLAPKQALQPWDGRLKRATASGTNQVILTEPSSDFAYPLGWRE